MAWPVLKNYRPYVEPDAPVLKTLGKEKQVRRHAYRLHELGAGPKTVEATSDGLRRRLIC